jgi:hypothetical protein
MRSLSNIGLIPEKKNLEEKRRMKREENHNTLSQNQELRGWSLQFGETGYAKKDMAYDSSGRSTRLAYALTA